MRTEDCGGQYSLPTMWVSGISLRLLGLLASSLLPKPPHLSLYHTDFIIFFFSAFPVSVVCRYVFAHM